ncbi:outer membrane protein 15 [Anaplasma marginale str. St. Maries]|nr:outer membrane protein 15 [Anaplasma marginale str. St. Maries]
MTHIPWLTVLLRVRGPFAAFIYPRTSCALISCGTSDISASAPDLRVAKLLVPPRSWPTQRGLICKFNLAPTSCPADTPAPHLLTFSAFSITPSLAAFIGGTASKTLGTNYDNTPAHRAVDDASPLGKTKEKVSASFGLRNIGVELGIRFGF